MKDITICFPYYQNGGILREQFARFRALPAELREHLRVIVVDDGSPSNKAIDADAGAPGCQYELYRITVDVRWNQDAARNIAAEKAQTDWLLLLDIDHIPTEATLRHLVHDKHSTAQVFRFSRCTLWPDGRIEPYKPHPNSWFMTKSMYWKIGGYDERFAGLYGTDADFKERVEVTAGLPVMLPQVLLRVPRETIPDASTTTYGRKEPQDAQFKEMRRARNATPGWQPQHFRFPYERVI